jgi:hypothetical protein
LVELFIAMILGSVKNEHCFSTLSFLKSKLRNQLTKHLDLIVKTFAHDDAPLSSLLNPKRVQLCQIVEVDGI